MRKMFEVVVGQNETQIKISREEIDLTFAIADHIDTNFMASDFLTIKNVKQAELQQFGKELEQMVAQASPDAEELSLSLNQRQYQIFKALFTHAENFLDEEFEDDDFEVIERIADIVSPPI